MSRTALALWVLALMAALGGTVHGQCLADFDDSGAVEINELIAAVNEALGGCGDPAPTPTAVAPPCPHDFLDQEVAWGSCWHRGRVNGQCDVEVRMSWRSDTQALIATFETRPLTDVAASITGPRRASLIGWSRDAFATIHLLDGSAEIDDGGRFIITTTTAGFRMVGCDVTQFIGEPAAADSR